MLSVYLGQEALSWKHHSCHFDTHLSLITRKFPCLCQGTHASTHTRMPMHTTSYVCGGLCPQTRLALAHTHTHVPVPKVMSLHAFEHVSSVLFVHMSGASRLQNSALASSQQDPSGVKEVTQDPAIVVRVGLKFPWGPSITKILFWLGPCHTQDSLRPRD